MTEFNCFFNPKTIAIIGASEAFKFGYGPTHYLLNSNFKTYPVNLTKNEIFGHKAYKNVKDIPDDIDLALIIVGNDNVLQAVKDCVEKRVKGIIIETAGFAETGIDKYIKIQKEIEQIAKHSKVRIIGPNCVGVTNFINGFTTSEVDVNKIVKGNISIIAQSGVLGNVVIDWAISEKIGFSKAITLGNKVDIDEIDMLEYLQEDPDTTVITIYLEDVRRGKEFLSVLKKITKPIIVLKNGRSESGAIAIRSHTASIAGNDRIFDAILKQNPNVFRVNNFYQMFDIAHAFATQPLPKGKNIVVITGSGSMGIIACDEIERQGLILAKLDQNTINSMKQVAPNWVSVKNPVDLGPSQFNTFVPSLKAVLSDNNVDCLLFIFTVPQMPLETWNLSITQHLRHLKNFSKEFKKPCIICVFGSRWVYEYVLKDAVKFKIPVMTQIKYAIKAFKMMYEFGQHLDRKNR